MFRVDEDVGAHTITYGDFRPPGDNVLVFELLEAVQQGQQSFLQDIVGVAVIDCRQHDQNGEKRPES